MSELKLSDEDFESLVEFFKILIEIDDRNTKEREAYGVFN
jgi:hypothetical protein